MTGPPPATRTRVRGALLALAVFVGLSASALLAYPGRPLVFIVFCASYLLALWAAAARPRLHAYSILAGLLFLGFWWKTVVELITGRGIVEPVGAFARSGPQWDRALWVATAAAAGLLLARSTQWIVLRRWPALVPPDQAAAPDWYAPRRALLWTASLAVLLAANVSNAVAAFYQIGMTPHLLLPLRLHIAVAWIVRLGGGLWMAALLGWEVASQGRAELRPLAAAGAEAVLASTSAMSRSIYLLRSVAYMLGLTEARLGERLPRRRVALLVTGWAGGFLFSLVLVSWARLLLYSAPPEPAAATLSAPPVPTTPGLSTPAAAAVDTLPHGPKPTLQLPSRERVVWMAIEVVALSWQRWVGLEGVLAVSSDPRLGAPLLRSALREDPRRGVHSLYQSVARTKYPEMADRVYLTLPGMTAVFFYSGSILVVLMGTALAAGLAMATEVLFGRWLANPFVLAMAGAGMADTLSQMNFPYLAGVFFVELWVTLLLIGALRQRWLGERRLITRLAVALALLLPAGCRRPQSIAVRLMPEEPQRAFDERADSVQWVVFRERFLPDAESDALQVESLEGAWTPLAATGVSTQDGGLALPPALSRSWYIWPLRRPAEEFDGFRVEASGWQRGDLVTLCWAAEGQVFLEERCSWQTVEGESGPRAFDLARHPRWHGRIERMKVQLTTRPDRRLVLGGVSGFRLMAADSETAWRVELAGETRSAWVTRPGTTVSRTVRVPAGGGRLRIGYALSGVSRDPVVFEVRAATSGLSKLLHSQLLDPAQAGYWPAWKTAEPDLAEFSGKEVILELATHTRVPGEPRGHAFWAEPTLLAPAQTRRPSVLLISVDTLRADRLSLYGYGRHTSPHLTAWAKRSAVVFETVVAAAPWTLPSHVSLLSGLYPFRHGVNVQGPVPAWVPLLAERFRAGGFTTGASTLGPLLTPPHGLARGFDSFHVRGDPNDAAQAESELARGVDEAMAWIDGHRDEPFFYFLHTYEPHTPYLPRRPFVDEFSAPARGPRLKAGIVLEPGAPGSPTRFRFVALSDSSPDKTAPLELEKKPVLDILYDSGVAFTDAQIGRLLDHLRRIGLESDTVVVVTSDHGESILDHGLAAHGNLYDDNLLVPLVIAAPGPGFQPRRVTSQVRSVDVAPTLLELAGLAPLAGIDGQSLIPLLRGGQAPDREAWAYASGTDYGVAVRQGHGWKYTLQDSVWDPGRGTSLFVDLRHDPGEQGEGQEAPGSLRRRILDTLDRSVPGPRMRFWNRGPEMLEVSLRGDPIRPGAMTSTDLDFSCCTWQKDDSMSIRVPPGQAFTLWLQDRQEGRVETQSVLGKGKCYGHALDLSRLDPPVSVASNGHGWRLGGGGGGTAGWTAWTVGPRPLEGPTASRPRELQESLRSLGYIE